MIIRKIGYLVSSMSKLTECWDRLLYHLDQKNLFHSCYGDISYHNLKMDSSNLNVFSELSSLGGDHFSIILTKSVDLRCYFIGLLVGLLVEKLLSR